MKEVFVDTNIFIRYLLEDEKEQVEQVENLFRLADEGEIKLVTNWLVMAEIDWALTSFYKLSKAKICKAFEKILALSFLEINKKDLLFKAVEIYKKKNVDFVDCLNFVFAKDKKLPIASFDRDFDKINKRVRYRLNSFL